jgi:hypothetical protein
MNQWKQKKEEEEEGVAIRRCLAEILWAP